MARKPSAFQRMYGVVTGRTFGSYGAMASSLGPEFLAAKPWVGSGVVPHVNGGSLRAFGGQVAQRQAAITSSGVGGLATGQVILQPLSDPYNG